MMRFQMPPKRYCVGKESFEFNHKIMIIRFKSRHIILRLLGNIMVYESSVRDWLCKGKTHHLQCTLPKIGFIIVWLFFKVKFLFVDLFLRSTADLTSWRVLHPHILKSTSKPYYKMNKMIGKGFLIFLPNSNE
jgi:hypothetical protein